jgi:hypothetical protein
MLLTNQNFINLISTPERFTTEYVVIDTSVPSNGLDIALAGGFLIKLSHEYFKCKRSVAETLELSIISEYA